MAKVETPDFQSLLERSMQVTEQHEADAILELWVQYMARAAGLPGEVDDEHRANSLLLARDHIGYYSGYHSIEVQARVERLFQCKHPIFGSVNEPQTIPTFKLGLMLGEAAARRRKGEPSE
jgi:hypothetical protein